MNNNYIISIPRDLKKIQSKLFFGLTKRQLVGFGIASILGLITFLLFKNISLDIAMYAMFFVSAPILFATIFQKDNMYIEKWFKLLLEQKYLNPNIRRFKVTKRNFKLAKERGIINETDIKRRLQQQRIKENELISNASTSVKQKKKHTK